MDDRGDSKQSFCSHRMAYLDEKMHREGYQAGGSKRKVRERFVDGVGLYRDGWRRLK